MIKLSTTKLRLIFLVFFLALVIPSCILSWNAYEQLQWKSLHQYQQEALLLTEQIDRALISIVKQEEARADTDYTFLVLAGDPNARFVQRSELSKYPIDANVPGLIGYFQIDSDGRFSTPLLPEKSKDSYLYGVSNEEKLQRSQLEQKLRNILMQNKLVSAVNEEKTDSDEVFQEASSGAKKNDSILTNVYKKGVEKERLQAINEASVLKERVAPPIYKQESVSFSELQSEDAQNLISKNIGRKIPLKKSKKSRQKLASSKLSTKPARENRIEKTYSPQQLDNIYTDNNVVFDSQSIQINLFESELEPFRFSLLSSGHFVLYRQVWRNKKRVIQGALLSIDNFLEKGIKKHFSQSILKNISRLNIVYGEQLIQSYQGGGEETYSSLGLSPSASPLKGELLYSSSLSEPLSSLSLIFNITDLPKGPGAHFILLMAVILIVVLTIGTYLLYRLATKHLSLIHQQQNFVSSVSHELKTPLTSIRMYGEILQQGWASEEKKKSYYDYIFEESERLSRLIENVLQISKSNQEPLKLELTSISINELISVIESKISTQINASHFQLNLDISNSVGKQFLNIDQDAFIQIVINLVDNAIKYSAKSEIKKIDLKCYQRKDGHIVMSIRDYGPGIPKRKIKRIFELFYRVGDEMTRESKGTGIGLALVKELTKAMSIIIKVKNHSVGVEFTLIFPIVDKKVNDIMFNS
ncbi:sensor histidine kinase [Aliikangiella sp. IMCC44359]|uniref:sensor histidine kinase n=1 Tax=Aliikangiella sp. IMCC44359 TaxID=3459125 RepID=UPI00403ACA71